MCKYFPKPNSFYDKSRFKKYDRSWYIFFCKKTDLGNLKSDVDKLNIVKLKNISTDLTNLKSKVDKIVVDKLLPVPVNLSKLSDVVKNDVVKEDVYNAKIKDIEYKIPNITNLATNASLNAKINEIKSEISSITNLVLLLLFLLLKIKIPSVSNLVKKTDYNTKVNETEKKIINHNHHKYIAIPELNKLTS